MKLPTIVSLALIVLSVVSCTSMRISPEDVKARAISTTEVIVKNVELRVHTTGSGKPEPSVASAEISVHGTSNVSGLNGFRLVFVPAGHPHLRQPYREGDHWTVLQQLEALDGWISALKDIPKNEGVTLTLWQTADGEYTLTSLRLLTRK